MDPAPLCANAQAVLNTIPTTTAKKLRVQYLAKNFISGLSFFLPVTDRLFCLECFGSRNRSRLRDGAD
jgi:hypothetical protein